MATLYDRIQKIKGEGYQEKYETGHQLYCGDAYEVFQTNRVEGKQDESKYLSYNIFSQITDTFSSLILFEKPRFTFKNAQTQAYFDEFINNSFFEKLKLLLETNSYAGDAVCYLNIRKEKPEIVLLPNERWIPLYDENRPDLEAEAHCIEYRVEEKDKTAIFVYQIFDNENLTVGFQAFKKENGVGVQVPVPEQFLTPKFKTKDDLSYYRRIPTPLFFRFYNKKEVGDYFGVSDYSNSIVIKAEEINNQLELQQKVLIETADPIRLVPKTLIQQTIDQINKNSTFADTIGFGLEAQSGFFSAENNNENNNNKNNNFKGLNLQETMVANAIVRKSKILPVGIGEGTPEFISYEPHTQKMEAFIEVLKRMIYNEARLSPVLFDKNVSVGDLSGVALQRLIQETIHKANDKIMNFEVVLKELIFSLCVLAEITPEIPTIQWYDGIIDAKIDKIDENERLFLGGFITKKEAIKNINGLTDEQADQELLDIETENVVPLMT